MPEIETLKRRDEFRRVNTSGRCVDEPGLALRYVFSSMNSNMKAGFVRPRFGFQIKKKQGRPSAAIA